jgi:hypothetical protein
MVALISGCGSIKPAEIGTGSDGGNTVANAQKGVKFAECMRHNGVSQFPDPGASGKLTIDAVGRLLAEHEQPGVRTGHQRV